MESCSFLRIAFFFLLHCQLVGSYVSDQRLNLCPLHWKFRVWTTGPLGKSFWGWSYSSEKTQPSINGIYLLKIISNKSAMRKLTINLFKKKIPHAGINDFRRVICLHLNHNRMLGRSLQNGKWNSNLICRIFSGNL